MRSQVFALGREHAALWLSPLVARVAIIYDFDNVFAWQAQPQSTAFGMEAEIVRMYEPFWRNGVPIDVLSAKRILSGEVPLDAYRIVVLPVPMLIDSRLVGMLEGWVGARRSTESAVQRSLWVGYRSDLKELQTNQMRREPSRLAALAGVQVAEFESLLKGRHSSARPAGLTGLHTSTSTSKPLGGSSLVEVFQEALEIEPARVNDTRPLWVYDDTFFGRLGYVAVTRRALASGSEVVYMGCGIASDALDSIAQASLLHTGMGQQAELGGNSGVFPPEGVELVHRDSTEVWINHTPDEQKVSVRQPDGNTKEDVLAPYAVKVAARPTSTTVTTTTNNNNNNNNNRANAGH